jgi:hypothetical protein
MIPSPEIRPIGNERFRIGDCVLLKRLDGTELLSRIPGTEMHSNSRNDLVVLLKDLSQDDVPIGTEVWSADGI